MFAGQTIVVLGATGVVGSGVVRRYLGAGARVVGVSRQRANLERLAQAARIGAHEAFVGVVADLRDEPSAAQAKAAILGAAGGVVDHVVTAQGGVALARPPTESSVADLERALDDGLVNNLLAAKALLPALRTRAGSSFTLVSGGLAHGPPPTPALWLGTVKNAAVNALTHALATETAADPVRVNAVCIHFGVAPIGGRKNQFGLEAEGDALRLGAAFVGLAKGSEKGQVVCLSTWADADRLGAR